MKLDIDSIGNIIAFVDAATLVSIRHVSKEWCILSDCCPVWKKHFKLLIQGKQNLQLEPWVRVSTEVESEDDKARAQIEMLLLVFLQQGNVQSYGYEALKLVQLVDLLSAQCAAAPLTNAVRFDQIEKEEELDELPRDQESGTKAALHNIETPVAVTEELLGRFRKEGRLLDWRETYAACVMNSRRTRITYGEYRLQGDWLAKLYFPRLMIIRFVGGGRKVIGNVMFFDVPGDIIIRGLLTEVRTSNVYAFTRDPEDWGWIGAALKHGPFLISTFDRNLGMHAHDRPIMCMPETGEARGIDPIVSPLQHQPQNGLYVATHQGTAQSII